LKTAGADVNGELGIGSGLIGEKTEDGDTFYYAGEVLSAAAAVTATVRCAGREFLSVSIYLF